jgi:hypothetical protein
MLEADERTLPLTTTQRMGSRWMMLVPARWSS